MKQLVVYCIMFQEFWYLINGSSSNRSSNAGIYDLREAFFLIDLDQISAKL